MSAVSDVARGLNGIGKDTRHLAIDVCHATVLFDKDQSNYVLCRDRTAAANEKPQARPQRRGRPAAVCPAEAKPGSNFNGVE